ncbi:MAG: 16S rRNA (adenine(1518)-N(6)/adenine(1519)-N(6))-dimethyltransferase RsmA [marine benthic group bacterium]|nr:16S rRNA (adenine(1518)-N(6)/adenine(1519)-N(6))-dimethyltransferase RsmA [Gemmatimonadota bacterium]MCL7979430.1 16S rRNA (adenine(1518)-N(6)/adenine(1519)-N(6))-dimethyltransferase RsmA [Gemmatimonadota bacterium]MCL7984252.1 16S rRNA (adenine(1518)-N(6)/adenine(1519)-N(6))-dimethyltransferase RsmA [Gemmatimonadota bacterium]
MIPDSGRVRARRSLSQNFLIDHNLRRKLVAALEALPTDTVLEVGPGHGELSELIVGEVERLVLIEKDDRLFDHLHGRWGDRDDVEIVHADALEIDLSKQADPSGALRVISNVPYSITSPLLFRLLELRPAASRILVVVQAEVGRRIVADPGSREYGALSVGVRTRAEARLAFQVGRQAFRPVPDVESVAVVIDPFPDGLPRDRAESLRRLTRVAFSRRRKQLRGILRDAPEYRLPSETAEALLSELGVDPSARPETLAPDMFVQLAERLEKPG